MSAKESNAACNHKGDFRNAAGLSSVIISVLGLVVIIGVGVTGPA